MNSPTSSSLRGLIGRTVAVAAVGLLGATMAASPSWAAAPANDELGGAVAVSLGDHVDADTTEATTTADDAALNASCGAPSTDASVWYSYTASTDGGVVLDSSASDYSAGFLVFEGTPTADSLVSCGPGTVGFSATAGTTYTIMVIDDQSDGTGNGGNLAMDVVESVTPTVDVSVDPRAQVDKSGTAWVTGSYSCSGGDNIEVDGELHQSVGRVTINGFGYVYDEGTCDGAPHDFSMPVTGDNGKFAGGKAASIVFSYACGAFECAEGYAEQQLQLSKGKVK